MTVYDIQGEQPPFFRRRRSVPRRRRRLWIRLLKPFSWALAIVSVPTVGVYWVMTSGLFRIAEVEVSGDGRIAANWARERLEALAGLHILTVDLTATEDALAGHPWLRGVEMTKRLPAHVEVEILERQAVALLSTEGGLFFLDSTGDVIAPYDSQLTDGDFVVVTAAVEGPEAVRESLQIAQAWSRVAGPWADGLSEVEAVDALSFRLHSSSFDFPILVTRENLEAGVAALRSTLPKIRRRFPTLESADLRFSGQVVFQPAVEPPTEG